VSKCLLYNIAQPTVQTALTPFNIFENNVNLELMLNESLNQLKFDISITAYFAKGDHLQRIKIIKSYKLIKS